MDKQRKCTEKSPLLPQVLTSPPPHLSSTARTFGNILISIVGAGVLGLPYTFMRTGWLAGLIVLSLVALLAYYCMMLLIWSKRSLQAQGFREIDSFGDLGFRVYGNAGKAMIDFMVVLCMAGVCVGYLIFIGNTISFILSGSEPLPNPDGNELSVIPNSMQTEELFRFFGVSRKTSLIWATFPLELAMNAIRSLTHLAPFSIFADVIDISAMLTVIVEDISKILQSGGPHVRAFTDFGSIPYGVGVAIYAFEGVTLVLPLELAMERKHKFGCVLGLAFMFLACIYGGFGFFGYFAFGNKTKDIITLNLGKSWVTYLVQVALCVNLFFAFPLMMNPVYEVLEGRFNKGEYSFIIRTLMVFLITMVAVLVPSFADFLSLIGSSAGCILGFIFPALFHLQACWHGSSVFQIIADLLIIVFGIVFGTIGTVTSVTQICTK